MNVVGIDPELGFFGGETQVLGLTLELKRAGHRAELLCDPRGALHERACEAGVKCHALAIRNAVDLAAGLRLRRFLARESFDVVHFHTSRAHSLAPLVRAGVTALVVTRRMDYPPNRLFAPWLFNRAVDGVAAISRRVADALVKSGVAREKITIIPSGVDCTRFHRAAPAEREAARRALGISPAQILIGAVGALEPRKGHRFLLQALAAVRGNGFANAVCVIAGEGPLRAELEREAARLRIEEVVHLTGHVDDSRKIFHALDIFAFPSLMEGLGVALLEAMASGLACVASGAGGPAEVIGHERGGVLVPAGDPGSLAEAIARLAQSREMRETIGAAARARVAGSFSMEAMARRTLALYGACLKGRQRAGGGRK